MDKITHEQYLKNKLHEARTRLKNIEIDNRIELARHETKRSIYKSEIDSIERQLDKGDK